MRIAIVSDIHGNLAALDAVIADIVALSPDLVVHGGDLVGGGSSPAEVIDRIRALKWPGVYGNADEMLWAPHRVAESLDAPHLRRIRDLLTTYTIPATREAIGPERVAWLRSLPMRWANDLVTVVHAGLDDVWKSPLGTATDEELMRVYGAAGTTCLVYGHIHQPYVRTLPSLTIANSGSVSLSYDGDPRAAYALIDDDRVTIRRVWYNVEDEIAKLRTSGDPFAISSAETLRTGKYVPLPAG